MGVLIWGGAGVAMIGVLGLLASGVQGMKARGGGLDEAERNARLKRAVILNLAALAVAVLGVLAVVAGLLLR
ncbi:MAG: hypothetical protein KGI94_16280 [Paracoccaceae bacterium]|nr:hypothetical protein [Paracoccaceae bacterium]MDE3123652.1 hypothetical protein [Paracoccaceae bacterium]MDE3237428.1 hypothetical protein [Paracoccaceae bacterium]